MSIFENPGGLLIFTFLDFCKNGFVSIMVRNLKIFVSIMLRKNYAVHMLIFTHFLFFIHKNGYKHIVIGYFRTNNDKKCYR